MEKDAQVAGIGRDNLRLIEVDETFAMRPEALARQIEQDRGAGLVPFFVCATVGTTSSNAMDPVPEIGRICREHKLWLHVDAAMSGTAALCPEFRHTHAGLDLADSYCFNPHKWMFTNFDCDCFYVADRKALIQTLSVLPEYLRNKATATGAVIDYRDWQIPLGRRFRALKLWFVIRHYGVEGLQHHIRQHVELAQQFAAWVKSDDRFELAAPVPLNLVCFRHKGGDDSNQTLMDRLNRSGDLYLTHTRLNDRLTLRLCVGQTNTTGRHVERAWKRIQEEAAKLGSVCGADTHVAPLTSASLSSEIPARDETLAPTMNLMERRGVPARPASGTRRYGPFGQDTFRGPPGIAPEHRPLFQQYPVFHAKSIFAIALDT